MIRTQADVYVVFYAIIPIWFIVIGLSLPQSGQEIWLVREGSRERQFARWTARMAREAFAVAGIAAIAGISTSIGLPLHAGFTASAAETSASLSAAGIPPLVALVGQILLMAAGLTSCAAVCYVLQSRWTTPRATVLILSVVYVVLMLGSVRFSIVPLSAGFLVYMHASTISLVVTLLALCLAIVLLVLAVRITERSRSIALTTRQVLIAITLLVALMLSNAASFAGSSFSVADLLRRAFAGGTPDRLHITGFATYTIVVGIGALWVGTRSVAHDRSRLPLLAVRYGRITTWTRAVLLRIIRDSAFLGAAVVIVSVCVTLLLGGHIQSPDLGLLVGTAGLIGALQTALLAIIFAATGVVSDSPRVSLIVFTVTLVLAAPPINRIHALPFGLSLTGEATPEQFVPDLVLILIATGIAIVAALTLTRLPTLQRHILGRIS